MRLIFSRKCSGLPKIFSVLNMIALLLILFTYSNSSIGIKYGIVTLVYSILFLVCSNNRKEMSVNPGLFTVNVIFFIRYNLTIISYYISNNFSVFVGDYSKMDQAIIIMVYEMVIIFISIEIFFKNFTARCKCKMELDRKYQAIKGQKVFFTIAIIILIILAYFNRSLIGSISILFGKTESIVGEHEFGLVTILWQSISMLVYVYVLYGLNAKYRKSKSSSCIVISLLSTVFYILFVYVCQWTISRWYMIISTLAAIALHIKLYPHKKKQILSIIGVPFAIIFITATVFKNGSIGFESGFSKAVLSLFDSSNFDAYFAGLANVNASIIVANYGEFGLVNIFYDLVNNMPVVNHSVDTAKATVNVFNSYLGRGDQIIPLLGQGICYFSALFAPLLSVFNIVVIRYFDKKYKMSDSMISYVFCFAAVWMGLIQCLNLTIALSWIYCSIIPFIFIVKLCERKVYVKK